MSATPPRLAVRALILRDNRLLLVNAWANPKSDLWCAPGGGVEKGTSLPENLMREVHEETGLRVTVGELRLVNEFHDPPSGFHQVELFFRCDLVAGDLEERWQDPERVVTRRRFFTQDELQGIRFKPGGLINAAFGSHPVAAYDPLERIVR
ncbi:NUDIX domain-containing protein [Actibacterium lipolyticum]|uniref:Bifunctional nicotinamide mononucleotide adenylyltransferase/ADP-ribose pyrophosphatase n=1 Tax=Actibacterium lipolyticum TaxID=1524263 RepID=A0A238JP86_9RHOB|nr:NUDIX domain-containing protein [Actibacterium lipolyticum]SMX31682.1 bifunctional nicotinamide mononucleotide adenylyltransferase/ADP-ribose pyrophosphatase [Actibacterium lipolyticum]